jgi:CubicO group peptidase (beta-lactamase class C family)
MQLVEKGLVGLDDDVRDIVPELKDIKVLLGFQGEEASSFDGDLENIAKGLAPATEKPRGEPIFEDVKGGISLR